MGISIGWDGAIDGDIQLAPAEPQLPQFGFGETADWIAQRNAQLGILNEFEPGGLAQPLPANMAYAPQPESPVQMTDDFYALHVLGVMDYRRYRMTPPKSEACTVYQHIKNGLQIVKWGNL